MVQASIEHYTIYIAETARLTLFCVVETSSPVDSYVTFLAIESRCSFHTTSSADPTELEESIEDGAIVPDVEAALLFLVHLHIVGRYFTQEFDVFVGVELCHFKASRWFRSLLSVRYRYHP